MRDFNELQNALVESEGIRRFAYNDTLGYVTIGCGRNIDERGAYGLSVDEIFYLLNNDIERVYKELSPFQWFKDLDFIRQDALLELCFNLGLARLLKFVKMIDALSKKDYQKAASELEQSLWTKQVGPRRSLRLITQLRTGRRN